MFSWKQVCMYQHMDMQYGVTSFSSAMPFWVRLKASSEATCLYIRSTSDPTCISKNPELVHGCANRIDSILSFPLAETVEDVSAKSICTTDPCQHQCCEPPDGSA